MSFEQSTFLTQPTHLHNEWFQCITLWQFSYKVRIYKTLTSIPWEHFLFDWSHYILLGHSSFLQSMHLHNVSLQTFPFKQSTFLTQRMHLYNDRSHCNLLGHSSFLQGTHLHNVHRFAFNIFHTWRSFCLHRNYEKEYIWIYKSQKKSNFYSPDPEILIMIDKQRSKK